MRPQRWFTISAILKDAFVLVLVLVLVIILIIGIRFVGLCRCARERTKIIPVVLSMIIAGIIAAVITQKIGYYVPPMLIAPVLCSVGAGLLSTLSPTSKRDAWIG